MTWGSADPLDPLATGLDTMILLFQFVVQSVSELFTCIRVRCQHWCIVIRRTGMEICLGEAFPIKSYVWPSATLSTRSGGLCLSHNLYNCESLSEDISVLDRVDQSGSANKSVWFSCLIDPISIPSMLFCSWKHVGTLYCWGKRCELRKQL